MKESFIQQCFDILKSDDVKNEFKNLLKPAIDFVLNEIKPYIYIMLGLIFLIFIMISSILVILLLLLRNKQLLAKII